MTTSTKVFYRLDLTPHQRMALMTLIGEYIRQPDAIQVSIDATTDSTIELSSLLSLVMDATPIEEADDG